MTYKETAPSWFVPRDKICTYSPEGQWLIDDDKVEKLGVVKLQDETIRTQYLKFNKRFNAESFHTKDLSSHSLEIFTRFEKDGDAQELLAAVVQLPSLEALKLLTVAVRHTKSIVNSHYFFCIVVRFGGLVF